MFIIRAAFWLTLVAFFLPLGPSGGSSGPQAGALDAIVAARGAIIDMAGMCVRQPEVCNSGGAALQALGERAKQGVALVYKAIDQHGSFAAKTAGDEAVRGTLRQEDIEPAWRAPTGGGKA